MKLYNFEIDVESYIVKMKEVIKNKNILNHRELDAFAPNKKLNKEYSSKIKSLNDVIDQNIKDDRVSKNIKLDLTKTTAKEFYEYCYMQSDKIILDKKFLYYINVNTFIDKLIEFNANEIYDINDGIRKVYNSSNLYNDFKSDISVLEEIKDAMTDSKFKEQIKGINKIRIINELLVYLKETYEILIK